MHGTLRPKIPQRHIYTCMVHFALRSLKDTLTYACTYICDCECVYFWFLRFFAATVSNEATFMVAIERSNRHGDNANIMRPKMKNTGTDETLLVPG